VREQLASQFVAAPAGDVFALITTPQGLPASLRALASAATIVHCA
jgi:hypothetical protein